MEPQWKKNLKPLNTRPPEEARAIQRAGAKAGGEASHRRGAFRRSVRQLMAMKVDDKELEQHMKALGIEPNMLNAAQFAVFLRAVQNADVECLRYLRDTAGEKPSEIVEIGNLDGEPLATMDLSTLSDEQLQELLVDRRGKT